jgi:heavy metal sensor kinase
MRLSIRWRLAVLIATAMVLTLVAVLLAVRITLEDSLRSDLDDELVSDHNRVQADVILAPGEVDLQEIADEEGGSSIDENRVIFRDGQGAVLASSIFDAVPYELSEEETGRVLAGENVTTSISVQGRDIRVLSASYWVAGGERGILQVASDAEYINETVANVQQALVVAAVICVLAALLAGYWLARGAVRPIERVASVAAQIEAEDLDRRIHSRNAPSEVQRLSDTFDAMLDRLEKAFAGQRDFVMDMSHELRTPLTALRGNIDVLLMDDTIDAATRSQLERMSREVQRLVRLTSNLLYSAHAEAGREVERRPVDLDVLVLEVCRQARTLRPEVEVRMGDEDQVSVTGDYDLLKQVVLNLLDNAVKYSPGGSVVNVAVRGDADAARVVVRDQGPGIGPEQLPHIFQRMYRAENGRRRTTGAGLGLSISEWIAKAHGGRIEVESEPGKGSTFTLVLPRQADAATVITKG